jgi:hypothetical protein
MMAKAELGEGKCRRQRMEKIGQGIHGRPKAKTKEFINRDY